MIQQQLSTSERSTTTTTSSHHGLPNNYYRLSRMKKFQICLVVTAVMVLYSMEHEMITTSNNDRRPEDVDIKIKNATNIKVPPPHEKTSPPVVVNPPPQVFLELF